MANNIKKFFGKFAKSKKPKKNSIEVIEVKTGNKISYAGYNIGDTEAQEYSQTSALLTDLRNRTSIGEQIEVIAARDPDVSQSVWAFQRLCMQGINIEIKDLKGNRLPDAELLFEQQCKHWNKLGEDGLDGLIDNLHKIGLLYNVMMIEAVVGGDNIYH